MRLAKCAIAIGMMIFFVGCGNAAHPVHLNSEPSEIAESMKDRDEPLQPAETEDHPSLQKPSELTSNHMLIIHQQLYFYDATEDAIKPVVQDGNIGFAVSSPSKKGLAVSKGQYGPILILNKKMEVVRELAVPSLEEQSFLGIGDLRWLGEDRLLIGLDYNAYVRGYSVIDFAQEPSSIQSEVLAKASHGVFEFLDPQGEHYVYQYPHARPLLEAEAPAVYLDDHPIFQAKDPSSWIGKITVNTNAHQIAFPVAEDSQTKMVIGEYAIGTSKLDNVQSLTLQLAPSELLLDYVLDSSMEEGYVLSQLEGKRKLYQWKREQLPSLQYLTDLPDSIPASQMILSNERSLELKSNDRTYLFVESDKSFQEKFQVTREYLLEKAREQIDKAILEEHVTLIEEF